VAKVVDVSPITVSRALRNPEKVSPELREKILRTVEEMGYVPDLAARALASRHSGVVAVMCPVLSQQVFMRTMAGIEDRIRTTDLRIQYANTAYRPDEELMQTRAFLAHNPAGMILAGAERYDELLPILEAASCPVVHILDISQPPQKLAVGVRHREAAAEAVRYMLSRGYRRIAILGGSRSLRSRQRIEGYSEVLREAGLFDPDLIVQESAMTGVALGARLTGQLLDRIDDIDGIFCQSDDVALGVLFECQRRGIKVPEDFGICGFNDLEFAAAAQPGLTTVRIPGYEIGFQAADMLVCAVLEEDATGDKLDLGFSVIARGTTR
jgi:LacI family gluconate utilization system Gnt-I transcriptional repressor